MERRWSTILYATSFIKQNLKSFKCLNIRTIEHETWSTHSISGRINEKIPVLGYRYNRKDLNLFETNIFLEDVVNDAATKICTQSVKTFGIPKFSRKSIRERKMRGILCWHSLRVSRGRLKKVGILISGHWTDIGSSWQHCRGRFFLGIYEISGSVRI